MISDAPSPDPEPSSPNSRTDASKNVNRQRLRSYLQGPEMRTGEGFPTGTVDDIVALSDPPYYTACPNPFVSEVLEGWVATDAGPFADSARSNTYHREPFATDVSEGKNNSIYNAHSYHTKVPHRAIMRYILHYTNPGDIVLDGFCGTGMTGVAAQLCADPSAIKTLGYSALTMDRLLTKKNAEFQRLGRGGPSYAISLRWPRLLHTTTHIQWIQTHIVQKSMMPCDLWRMTMVGCI